MLDPDYSLVVDELVYAAWLLATRAEIAS